MVSTPTFWNNPNSTALMNAVELIDFAAKGISDIQGRMEDMTKAQIAQELEAIRVSLLTPTYTIYEDVDTDADK